MQAASWWLRSSGDHNGAAIDVDAIWGWIVGYGNLINDTGGVRPALHLNLSSSNLFSYAGTVSSNGNENEVPYNTKTKLVQK